MPVVITNNDRHFLIKSAINQRKKGFNVSFSFLKMAHTSKFKKNPLKKCHLIINLMF